MKKKFDISKLLINISIISLFIIVGLIVLATVGTIHMSLRLGCGLTIIGILALACMLVGIWYRHFENHKILPYIFICLITIISVLWMISVATFYASFNFTESQQLIFIKFVKILAIITMQISVANFMALNIIKYKKNYLPFQVIMYASNIFVDFWVSYLMFGITINLETGLHINNTVAYLFNQPLLTIFIVSVVFVILSNSILKVIEQKSIKDASQKVLDSEDIEKKLKKLDDLYNSNLISKEDYESRKNNILNKL